MQAITNLREHLMYNAALKLKAENLKTFIENGTIYTSPGASINGGEDSNKHFKLKYDAVIYVLDVALDPRYLLWVVGQWMNINQPEHTDDDIKFETDILSHTVTEFELTLKIKETVWVKETIQGTKLESWFGNIPCKALDVTIADAPNLGFNSPDIDVVPNKDI